MKKISPLVLLIFLTGCSGSSSGGGVSSTVEFKSANIFSTDKALLHAQQGFNSSAISSLENIQDNLMRIKADGSLESVEFTYDEIAVGGTATEVTAKIKVSKTKQLNERYLILAFDDSRLLNKLAVLDRQTGNVYGIENYVFDDIQIQDNNLFALKSTGELVRVDLTDLSVYNLTSLVETTVNTSRPVVLKSQLSRIFSPLSWLSGVNQGTMEDPYGKPSFLLGNGYVLAIIEVFGGGQRIVRIQEGAGTYECGSEDLFYNVGGGYTAGLIRGTNGSHYQLRIVSSANAGLPGIDNYEQLILMDAVAGGDCVAPNSPSTVVQELTDGTFPSGSKKSHFPYNDYIVVNTNYQLTTVERYILAPTGFIKTEDNVGAVRMTWTSLDLSDVPKASERTYTYFSELAGTSFIEGNNLYYLRNNTIKHHVLANGTSPTIFHTLPESIINFTVVDGVVYYSTADSTYKVTGPGQPREYVGPHLKNAVVF
ncbi:MAG: hypothetical protein K2Q26_00685 [Bdellovibrionales bacterium]|nr:hypothetical protein [Bdellovibrionales bacterium]